MLYNNMMSIMGVIWLQGKERLNTWSAKDYVKNIVMILIKVPVWAVQLLLFWLPLKKDRIIIYSLKQRGFSCNLKYFTQYLQENTGYELLWIVKSQEDLELVRQHGVDVALAVSGRHFRYRMRAGIVITNDEFYPMFRKRRGQRYVNLWHGAINYKKIGYAGLEFTNPVQKLIYKMNNPCPDAFVSGSEAFTRTASEGFGFPEPVFLPCGLPRNDVLFSEKAPEIVAKVKETLGISQDTRILLYAPTFRKGGFGPGEEPDYEALKDALSARFGGEWVIALRQHYFVRNEARKDILDVCAYEDMQELILASDAMISDYSSCMWDFLLTGKPCFVYAPDMAAYQSEDRAFFIEPAQWPYPISTDTEGLLKIIENFSEEDYINRAKDHIQTFHSYDNGHACQQLAAYLKK